MAYEVEVLVERVTRVVLYNRIGSKCLRDSAGQQQEYRLRKHFAIRTRYKWENPGVLSRVRMKRKENAFCKVKEVSPGEQNETE